jgi:hypothetical protein
MPINSRVFAGLRSSNARPLVDSTHSPLMKFLKTVGRAAVAIESSERFRENARRRSLSRSRSARLVADILGLR